MFFVFQRLGLRTLDWIMTKIFAISVIGVFILFQPELRQGLAQLGRRHLIFSQTIFKEEDLDNLVKCIGNVVFRFAEKKIGCLIAIERRDSLKSFSKSGVQMDAILSEELLETIFGHNNPLHDGGVIIVGSRVAAAGCLFPLTDDPYLSRTYGTRHRAGIGLSEEVDAVVIIVSEENGKVSLAIDGHLINDISKDELSRMIKNLISQYRRL